jgi:hypothetical protein
MPRGGRRPGAGAKPGNLNALRSGAHSKQFKALIIALMAYPEIRRVLLHFSRLDQHQRDLLGQAVNRYARLLSLPSRERSIKAVRRQQIRNSFPFPETIKDRSGHPP